LADARKAGLGGAGSNLYLGKKKVLWGRGGSGKGVRTANKMRSNKRVEGLVVGSPYSGLRSNDERESETKPNKGESIMREGEKHTRMGNTELFGKRSERGHNRT